MSGMVTKTKKKKRPVVPKELAEPGPVKTVLERSHFVRRPAAKKKASKKAKRSKR